MSDATVLIVDDEELIRWSLRERLVAEGHHVVEAGSTSEARRLLEQEPDLVLLDRRLPDGDGLAMLAEIERARPDLLVILMTAYSSAETAADAMKRGAYDYVRKPFAIDEMLLTIDKALETSRLRRELKDLRTREAALWSFDRLLGTSPAASGLRQALAKLASSPAQAILLRGENGTGKDLVARCLHHASPRTTLGPFVRVTCSGVPEGLLERAIFGRETETAGGPRIERGLVEQANRGTAYLDEIGALPIRLQARLLRLLEDARFRRVGGTADLVVDVRLVAATGRDLETAVARGEFREDLFGRLAAHAVRLPPLRERKQDLPSLARAFVEESSREFGKGVKDLSRDAARLLEAHSWPGNLRELRNVLERAVLLSGADVLEVADLHVLAPGGPCEGLRLPAQGLVFQDLERDLVRQALERTAGNQRRAAALLGMTRDQVRRRIQKFGLALPPARGVVVA